MSAGDLPSIARVSPCVETPKNAAGNLDLGKAIVGRIGRRPRMTCGRPTQILMQVSQVDRSPSRRSGREMPVQRKVKKAARSVVVNKRAPIDRSFRAKLRLSASRRHKRQLGGKRQRRGRSGRSCIRRRWSVGEDFRCDPRSLDRGGDAAISRNEEKDVLHLFRRTAIRPRALCVHPKFGCLATGGSDGKHHQAAHWSDSPCAPRYRRKHRH